MKFVGTIKGKPYLIDPETFEQEIREQIAQRIEAMPWIDSERDFPSFVRQAAAIAREEF